MDNWDSNAFSSTTGVTYSDKHYVRAPVVVGPSAVVTAVRAATAAAPARVIGTQVFDATNPAAPSFDVRLGGDGAPPALRVTNATTSVPSLSIGDWRIDVTASGQLRFQKRPGPTGEYVTKWLIDATDE
jgi:hypothetical protein